MVAIKMLVNLKSECRMLWKARIWK